MQYRKLGRTEIKVSVVAMGCDYVLKTWCEEDKQNALAAVGAALDEGINLFDTAEAYGKGVSEEVLGQALKGRRDQAVIATKVSPKNLAPEGIRLACEGSLKRLGTDYIDLYQIHWPSSEVPIADSMGALEALKKEGKIRAIGVSNFSEAELDGLAAAGRCEANQLSYSLLFRGIEHGLQQKCVADGIGIICYSPMFQGVLSGKYASADEVPPHKANTVHFSSSRPGCGHGGPGCEKEMFEALAEIRTISEKLQKPMDAISLAWVLAQPGIASVLAGARNPDQVRRNVRAAETELTAEAVAELSAATEKVKKALGDNLHMWVMPKKK